MLGVILASIFILLLIINGFTYLFNIDIITTIKNLFTNHPEIDINVNTPTPDDIEDADQDNDDDNGVDDMEADKDFMLKNSKKRKKK